jgi:glycosyltransferase involved in cell wall biosynthesis
MQSGLPNQGRLRVVVVSHSYNEPGRMRPFSALAEQVDLTLVGPREFQGTHLVSPVFPESEPAPVVIPLEARLVGPAQFFLRGLGKTLRSRRPDVVCVEYDPWHPLFLQVVFNLAITQSPARIVLVVKKNTYRAPDSILGRGKRLLSRWGVRRASMIIAASNMARDIYVRELGAPSSMVVVQPHLSVDVSRFQPHKEESDRRPLRIGFVGKIGAVKGVPDLLAAFKELLQRTPWPIELWLAGRITDPEVGEAISSTDQVRHLGMIGNDVLHLFMNDIDLFVMPARILPDHQEHDGRAVLEAMASGLPCVVSDSGILPEIVSSAEGRVFPAGNAAALADALEELINSPNLRLTLGVGARRRAVETVSPDVLNARRLELFNRTVEVPSERSGRG